MASREEICNLAISALGSGKEITNFETERTAEALACRRFYELARDEVLREFPWGFATKFVALGLVEEEPNDEWAFSYRYPSDCLKLRRILSDNRNDPPEGRIPYREGQDASGILVYTDRQEAEVEYTVRTTNTQLFPPDFTAALSLRLAAYIAPRITAGDPFKMGTRALQLYQMSIAKAQIGDLNEQQPDPQPESEFIRARE